MARSIYATFNTEEDAERATGALLDHGVAAEDVSFVVSNSTLHPTVFHPDGGPVAHTGESAAPVDAVAPPTAALPGTVVTQPHPAATPVAPAAPLDSDTAAQRIAPPVSGAAMLPANTPIEVVEGQHRPHIIDMESDRPGAADGISVTTAGDAAKGAAGGASLGLGLGILLGIAAIAVPGVGLVAGAGAIIAGLAAATGVAGGIAGGVYGYLADLGVPPHNARLINDHLKPGAVLLHVDVSGRVSEEDIVRLLTKYGATSAQGF